MRNLLPEVSKIVQAFSPATQGSGSSGDWISLKNVGIVYCVVNVTQGHSSQGTVSINQATAVAGTGSTAIVNTCRIWSNLDTAASDTLVERTAAVSYQLDAALKSKIVVIEVRPEDLDAGFDCIQVALSSSNSSNIASAMYYCCDLRNQGKSDNLPSVIVD